MSKIQAKRDFACIHTGCGFKTDKRKAIYTHLIRTHCERKEDYECEYCDTLFEEEAVIEEHLYAAHPRCQFRYTCVSRLENLLNRCAQLATDRKKAIAAKKSRSSTNLKGPACETVNFTGDRSSTIVDRSAVAKANDKSKAFHKTKHLSQSESSLKRKTSVNESLNNLAKLPRIVVPENPLAAIEEQDHETDPKQDEEINDILNDGETATYFSKPSGLKIKLNLKKIRDSCSRESSAEPQTDKDVTYSPSDLREMSPLNESDLLQTETSNDDMDRIIADEIELAEQSETSPASKTAKSSYLDKLEVYHTTDEFNRRCCPFCDYKTTKNTIRVHLAGKHKIYFVMCSVCDYRAAFPYQVQSHGFSCHQIRNIEVIHLAKSYREGVIARLKAGIAENTGEPKKSSGTPDNADPFLADEEGLLSESEDLMPPKVPVDTRVFKPPVCQTSKTDYYSIAFENDQYLYCCSQCDFKTPVRATIYTHKYRHEEKAYGCGYCDFVSAPRSNVAHHIRCRHKGKAFVIEEISGPEGMKLTGMDEENDLLADVTSHHQVGSLDISATVKQETCMENTLSDVNATGETDNPTTTGDVKPQKTIIKVPQFKRTLTTGAEVSISVNPKMKDVKPTQISEVGDNCKMSLNKLYRYNPHGTPKYLCNECPYACDTHPKMKHHLYRHKPQRYKCPYCNHRKYPRSYVVRHVRDTHRDKPMKVIDLLKSGENENDLDDSDAGNDFDDMEVDTGKVDDMHNLSEQEKTRVVPEARCILKDDSLDEQSKVHNGLVVKQEVSQDPVSSPPVGRISPTAAQKDESSELTSPDISTINRPLFNSTPITGSALFDVSSPTTQSSSRKPFKNYDVDTKRKPRYICNYCQYGTENYKTIHNHMYRHERIKYLCPYCGFKRAPRSFVENHIRDVHKGQPVLTTEVVDEDAEKVTTDGLTSNSSAKRKDISGSATPSALHPTIQKKLKTDISTPDSVKWPTSKSPAKVSSSLPEMPPLQIPIKKKTPGSSVSPIIPSITVPTRPLPTLVGPPNVTISASSPVPFRQNTVNKQSLTAFSPNSIKSEQPQQNSTELKGAGENVKPKGTTSMPSYKDGGKTTFKTMYKCVFDPETCNHISKDRSKMKQHIFMHVEYKPWSCDYCNMTASQSSHVKNHVRTEHPEAEISFQYKRHNYLEKHIDSFLQKGIFTVPVSEYRFIMDMKGSSKKPQFEYARDSEGYLLCPHCDYRTKSGGMADHVKMKHMLPRFKCHWCDFKAFYRSEIRKHHRKERGHAHLEFKTQELDLVEVMEDYKEGNGEISDALQSNTMVSSSSDSGMDSASVNKHDAPDSSEIDDDDISSNADSAVSTMSDSTALSNNLSDSNFLQLTLPYSFENIDASSDDVSASKDINSGTKSLNHRKGEDVISGGKIGVKAAEYRKARIGTSTSLYKCGYCMFYARLRTMVKMHCQKQHPYRKIHITEPKIKGFKSSAVSTPRESNGKIPSALATDSKLAISAKTSTDTEQLSSESLISKIAPLFSQDKSKSGSHFSASKKSKSLKSVIDQLSSKAQKKGENDVNTCENTASETTPSTDEPQCGMHKEDQTSKVTENICHEKGAPSHTSHRKKNKPHHVSQNTEGDSNENTVISENTGSENDPPVLTRALCDESDCLHTDDVRGDDATPPPLLIKENEKPSVAFNPLERSIFVQKDVEKEVTIKTMQPSCETEALFISGNNNELKAVCKDAFKDDTVVTESSNGLHNNTESADQSYTEDKGSKCRRFDEKKYFEESESRNFINSFSDSLCNTASDLDNLSDNFSERSACEAENENTKFGTDPIKNNIADEHKSSFQDQVRASESVQDATDNDMDIASSNSVISELPLSHKNDTFPSYNPEILASSQSNI